MKTPQSLRARIAFYFCGYLALLLTLYSWGIIGIFRGSQDWTFNRQLEDTAARIATHIETHGRMPDKLPRDITAYTDPARIPAELWEQVKNRRPGTFEIEPEELNWHGAVVPLASGSQTLYVFFNVESIESPDTVEWIMIGALGIMGAGIVLVGWLLARSLSNRILTPISHLAAAVDALSPDRDKSIPGSYTTPDEVGRLAATINQLLGRIAAFTRREREFTAHASHELRTPAAVVKGAVELLKGRIDCQDPAVGRPVARIERGVRDIEMLIDTFLLLARKGALPDEQASCHLAEVTEAVVAAHHHLLDAKPVELALQTEKAGVVSVPSSLVTIALGNLVRNAFAYTMRGTIEVTVLGDRVEVIDSGPGMEGSTPKGQGLGLTIVKRLCERMDWQFTIDNGPVGGTRAQLIFAPDETGKPASTA